MSDVHVTAAETAEDVLDALADQDWEELARLLAEDVWVRALLTRETVERHDAGSALELLREWHGGTDGFVVLDRERATIATRERVRFRFAERPRWAREQWHVIEQTGFVRVRQGRVSRLDLACTGYHPIDQPPRRFVSRRLVMRPWQPDDADRLLAIRARPEVSHWLSDPTPWTSTGQALTAIAAWDRRPWPLGVWAIVPHAVGTPVGSVALGTLPDSDEAQISIALHPEAQGHGIAREAVRATLRQALRNGVPRVWALLWPDNEPSARAAAAAGMADLGVRPDPWYGTPQHPVARMFRADATR